MVQSVGTDHVSITGSFRFGQPALPRLEAVSTAGGVVLKRRNGDLPMTVNRFADKMRIQLPSRYCVEVGRDELPSERLTRSCLFLLGSLRLSRSLLPQMCNHLLDNLNNCTGEETL